jgi:pimeloyl-ACP methyl ester carboxylesterase
MTMDSASGYRGYRGYRSAEGYQTLLDWYATALSNMTVPYESRIVNTRFGHTHLIVAGSPDAPPVVLVHGMFGNAMLWKGQFPALVKSYRVYAPDPIGEPGKSAPCNPSWQRFDQAKWLLDVFDSLEIERAHLVGISKGGARVLKFGTFAPERIHKLIVISPMAFVPTQPKFHIQFTRHALASLARGLPKDDFQHRLKTWMLPPTLEKGVDEAIIDEFFNLFYIGVRHFKISLNDWRLHLALPQAELRQISAPTYLLVGEHEIFFQPENAVAKAKRIFPNLPIATIIPDAGHAMIIDHPQV